MLVEVPRVHLNSHGKTLHYLDPVAGRVLSRQQCKRGPGPGRETNNLAAKCDRRTVDVRRERDWLPHPDIPELPFLEICVDPDLLKRHDRHQWRAWRYPLANLYRTL